MKKNKNVFKSILLFTSLYFVYVIFISVLNYFDIINGLTFKIVNFITLGTLMFSSGFYLAKNSNSKGYKAGLIMGLINMGILFVISILLRSTISYKFILYFLILVLTSTIGGMAGINFNMNKSKRS